MSKNHPNGNNVMNSRYKRRHGEGSVGEGKSSPEQKLMARSYFEKMKALNKNVKK